MATVLVVDDDEMVLSLFEEILELLGHETVCMNNAESALESLLDGLQIDVLMTDVIMPGMDGRDFVRTILKHPDSMRFPIIMVSGETAGKDLSGLLENDRVSFLPKPIGVKELAEAMKATTSAVVNP